MKNLTAIASLLLFALTTHAALPQPDLIMQIYFAGTQKISAEHNSTAFTNEFCSTEALALRKQLADKLSVWLPAWLGANVGLNVPDGAAKLRPLFEDLQKSEFFLEIRAAADNKAEAAIAIKLDASQMQVWQAGLKPFFATASFKSTGGWLIFDSNPALLKLGDRMAQRVSAPPSSWFDIDINWPRLAPWYPAFKALGLPETQFSVTAPDNDFRINGKFYFPENLMINLEPWHAPTNVIHAPLNSFTAVRGFASWLQSQSWAQPYQISPTPNQLFVWSLPQAPFQTFAAVPVPGAASALSQEYTRLTPIFYTANLNDQFMEPITLELNTNEIAFPGTPFISLHLRALSDQSGEFLFGEMFPNSPRRREPLPQKLFDRLATKDIVYYHYEITASRIPQLLQTSQLALLLTKHKQLGSESTPYKWLQRIQAPLGFTDTEITQSGPAELTFSRKTPSIFTAPELLVLVNWFGAANFPGFDIKLPLRNHSGKHSQQQQFQLTTPLAAPSH